MSHSKPLEWTDELVARFWDFESTNPSHYFTYQFGDAMVSKLKKYFKRGARALDFGCGTGDLIPHLLNLGLEVTALDFSEKSVDFVNKRFHGAPHFNGAFLLDKLLNSGERFDVIFVIEVIEHLNDTHLQQTFSYLKKLLNDGGKIIFTTPNKEDLEASTVFCPQCQHTFHRWQHVRNWSKESLSRYLNENNFEVRRIFTTDFSSAFRKSKINFFKKIAKRLIGYPLPHLVCICGLMSLRASAKQSS